MKIQNKPIVKSDVKKCMVCTGECKEGTLTILGQVLCSECVDKIINMDLDNPEYYKIKDCIKKNIIKLL